MEAANLEGRLKLAIAAARAAGELTLRHFQTDDLAVELKADASPVTVADRLAEQLLRDRVGQQFPHDAFLGEEFGETAGSSGFRWIVDPIDGTKSFIHGVPLYGTMLAVEFEGRSVLGVVFIPPLDECVYAALGQGTWHSRGGQAPRRAAVSTTARLDQATFCTSDLRYPNAARQAACSRLFQACHVSRTWGDCYGYLLVATGRADVMVDPLMNVWDAAAIQPIILEAGGRFTDWQGEPTIYGGDVVASNGHLHDDVLAITRGA